MEEAGEVEYGWVRQKLLLKQGPCTKGVAAAIHDDVAMCNLAPHSLEEC